MTTFPIFYTVNSASQRVWLDRDAVAALIAVAGGTLVASANLSDVTVVSSARSFLGLSSAALQINSFFTLATDYNAHVAVFSLAIGSAWMDHQQVMSRVSLGW